MRIFFSVGEPSGDQHAAHLIHELKRRRPGIECVGYGGPLMESAGCKLHYPLTDLAVMGFLRVLPLIFQFLRLARDAGRYFRETPPDAVVLIDFPGFNWWIARHAKKAGVPVFYYMPPQLWAWMGWRVRRVRKFVDHVLCGLPFEQEWYAKRGVRADYVGHPFFDEAADYRLDNEFCESWSNRSMRIIGILPGSRSHEVEHNFPHMLKIMERLHQKHPTVHFLVACYKEPQRRRCMELAAAADLVLPINYCVGRTPEIIQTAECCLMVSGSVSLELLARGTPAVVIYNISRVLAFLRPYTVKIPFITLPNLIAGRALYPEWVTSGNVAPALEEVGATLDGWLSDPEKLKQVRSDIAALRATAAQTGATARTAQLILDRAGTQHGSGRVAA